MNIIYLLALTILLPYLVLNGDSGEGKRVIILLGPPASGKGTQASRLAKDLNIPHISTGDLFRENISKNTELGQKAKSFMDAGKLVPDELVLDMLFDRVSRSDASRGYVLDGFPRTIPQAEAFDKKLDGQEMLTVLNLNVSDETLIKRTSGRLACSECGSICNIYFSPPQTPGQCDKCKGKLAGRSDDKPEVVKERLKVYHSQTAPLIDYYKAKGRLFDIDGEVPADKVYSELKKTIAN